MRSHSNIIGDDDILSSKISIYSADELEGVWCKTDVKVSCFSEPHD
jgi:hypothetical protein